MFEKGHYVQIAVNCILCFSTLLMYTSTCTGNYNLQQYITVCKTYDIIALVLPVLFTVQNARLNSILYSIVYNTYCCATLTSHLTLKIYLKSEISRRSLGPYTAHAGGQAGLCVRMFGK
jgi:hypothetical protein